MSVEDMLSRVEDQPVPVPRIRGGGSKHLIEERATKAVMPDKLRQPVDERDR